MKQPDENVVEHTFCADRLRDLRLATGRRSRAPYQCMDSATRNNRTPCTDLSSAERTAGPLSPGEGTVR